MKKILLLISIIFILCSCNHTVPIDYSKINSNQLKFDMNLDISGCKLDTYGVNYDITDEEIIVKIIEYYCKQDLYLVDEWELDVYMMTNHLHFNSLRKTVDSNLHIVFSSMIYDDYFYIFKCDHLAIVYDGCISHTYRSKNKIDVEKFKEDIKNIVES